MTIKIANQFFINKEYIKALEAYNEIIRKYPELEKSLKYNIDFCYKKLKKNYKQLKYSVIMPTWNRINVIDSAIKSVIEQSYKNWELIIVDDHSSDGTVSYLNEKYKTYIKNQKIKILSNSDKGVSSARNTGLNKISGDIVTYLDSDNMWKQNYLEEINFKYELFFSIDAIYTAVEVVNRDTKKVFIRDVSYNRKNILKQNFIDLNIFSHRAELLLKYGMFNTVMSRLVDYELIIRYTRNKNPLYINKSLATYVFDSNNNQISNKESYEFNSKLFKELNKIELNKFGLNTKENYLSIEEKIEINRKKNIKLEWNKQKKRIKGCVSIIIPVFNNIEYTKRCIDSIITKTTYDNYEIIIVDNYSTDMTAEWFYENNMILDKRVKYIRNDFNYGYSVGNNVGFSYSKGEYLLLLNNDTEILTSDWLEQFIESIDDPSISIVGPKLLFDDYTVQCSGIVFNNVNSMPYHIYQGKQSRDPLVNKSRIFQATTGACLFMKSNTYSNVKGFSPDFLNGAEDIDLCLKINEMYGTRVKYIHTIEILHHESKSVGRSIAIGYNRQLLYKKWLKDLQPRDDIKFYANDNLIINEYKKNKNDVDKNTAMYLPVFHVLPFRNENIKSIIIFKPSGIGNMIMFTPALFALKKMFTNARFTVACYSADAGIISEYVDNIIILNKKKDTGSFDKNSIEKIVKKGEYQLAIYPQFTSIGRPTEYLKKVIPYHIFGKNIDYENRHEVLHNMDVAYMLGWKEDIPEMMTPIDKTYIVDDKAINAIVIHVGASDTIHMQKKKWLSDNWIEVIQNISKKHTIVFVGGPNESKDIDVILEKLDTSSIIRYDGQLTLAQTGNVIRASKLMISTDSGLMHMAAALKKPLVAIFGPTLLSKNSAWGKGYKRIHVQSKMECAPCYADPKKLFECPDAVCMKEISSEEVIKAIYELLGEKNDRRIF